MHTKKEMIEFVVDFLKTKIPAEYYYHNYLHSLYVMEKAVEIGTREGCPQGDLELIAVAALWHDTGYVNQYKGHEEESCRLATHYLPLYGYRMEEIERICGMIMATKIPQQPQTRCEEILADADLEYLGTEQAAELANDLFKEMNALNSKLTKESWRKMEIGFLSGHQYFTGFCKKHKQPQKESYLNSLINKNN